MDLICRSQSPHGRAKLEDLGAATRGVMNAVLRPSHYLTQIIGSGGEAIVSSREVGQSPHLVVLPNEPEVDVADVIGRTVEVSATPALAQRLRGQRLGNTDEDSRGIFHIPCDAAVWSAQCLKIS